MRWCEGGHACRAVLTAGAVVALSLLLHLAAGGSAPELPSLVALTALTAAVTGLLTRRRVELPSLMLVLGLVQVTLHVAFDSHGPGHTGGHGPTSGAMATMVAVHAAATLLTALLFAQGRAALRSASVWQALRRLVRAPRRLPTTQARPPVPQLRRPPTAVWVRSWALERAPPSPIVS
ncbi:hypothetical protein [Georgenia sunbinii]|uniref:hypothetical protein n=1 Tax=Georgenia sunbinii TaxID=3117728 RepID=UPI002F26CABD